MRILILEDDVDLAGLLATGLRAESYAVDVATTLDAATELLIANPYDIACIDLGLPDGDGLALVRELALGEAISNDRSGSSSPRPGTRSRLGSRASTPARTTTWSSRSRSPSSRLGSGLSVGGTDDRATW